MHHYARELEALCFAAFCFWPSCCKGLKHVFMPCVTEKVTSRQTFSCEACSCRPWVCVCFKSCHVRFRQGPGNTVHGPADCFCTCAKDIESFQVVWDQFSCSQGVVCFVTPADMCQTVTTRSEHAIYGNLNACGLSAWRFMLDEA